MVMKRKVIVFVLLLVTKLQLDFAYNMLKYDATLLQGVRASLIYDDIIF